MKSLRPGMLAIGSILILFTSGLAAQTPPPERQAQELLDNLQRHGQFMKPDGTPTPAVSGAVARHGRVVFSSGAGMIDLENLVPARGNSVYNIGSLSKAFTAIAVMQLVEQKKVALDDDIRKWVPEFPDKGVKITVWNLLTHTSGIRHYRKTDFPGTPDNENIDRSLGWKEGLAIFDGDPLLFPPGKYFSYTSYGVNLLQGVVEKASGESFEDYLRHHIWEPSGASQFSVDVPDRIVPHRARSYRIDHGQTFNYYYNDLHYKFASGAMIASVEDLVKTAIALNHDKLLQPATRAEMFRPQIDGTLRFRTDGPPDSNDFQQAMLWRVNHDAQGRTFRYECGSVKAFNACLIDYVDEDLVAAIATNSDECCGWKAVLKLADYFRDQESKGAH